MPSIPLNIKAVVLNKNVNPRIHSPSDKITVISRKENVQKSRKSTCLKIIYRKFFVAVSCKKKLGPLIFQFMLIYFERNWFRNNINCVWRFRVHFNDCMSIEKNSIKLDYFQVSEL